MSVNVYAFTIQASCTYIPITSNIYWHPDGQRAYSVTRNFAVIPQQSPSIELVKKCSEIWDDARKELQAWQKKWREGPTTLGYFAVFNDVSPEKLE